MNPHAQPPEAQPSLAQAIAALAGDLRAHADRRGQEWGPIAALHALLLTALARLFGRLETLAHAWQQGLVAPAPARRRRTRSKPAHRPDSVSPPRSVSFRRRASTRARVAAPARPHCVPAQANISSAQARCGATAPAAPYGSHATHARSRFSNGAWGLAPSHVHFVTLP